MNQNVLSTSRFQVFIADSTAWDGGVQLPDSLGYEAVSESGGAVTEAVVPSPWRQEDEQTVCGVAGVAHNHGCFSGEAGGEYVLQGGECGTYGLSSCVLYALRGFPVVVSAAPAPHSDTAALSDALKLEYSFPGGHHLTSYF